MSDHSTRDPFAPVIAACALAIGIFHLLNISGILSLSTMEIRIIHLAAMMVILFLTQPLVNQSMPGEKPDYRWAIPGGVLPALIVVVIGTYMLSRWEAIALSGGNTNVVDLYVGILLLMLIL